MQNIIIATIKEWNIQNYFELKNKYQSKYNFHIFTSKEELNIEIINKINPKYIFFPHWSWIIPDEIYTSYESIVFHMTDLPYGRGGSPLQNLIMNEVYDTKISAIKVEEGLDAGDIYLKEDFNISKGSAQELFTTASNIIFEEMIPKFLDTCLQAVPQSGNITTFKRRTKNESNINTVKNPSVNKLYDFIRMLDAEGYPKAYIDLGNIKIELSDVVNDIDSLQGKFEVIENG